MRRLLVAAALATSIAGLSAQAPRSGPPPPASGRTLRVEITVPPSVRKEPVTGRVYFIVARAGDREPRLQVGRTGTPFFGRDVEGLEPGKAAIISFAIDGTHAHDLATLLDIEGIAVRSGQHCAHPLLQSLGVAATCRASFAFYNSEDEIDRFAAALRKVRTLLA